MLCALNVSGRVGMGLGALGSRRRWQAASPVEIELKELKQEIRQLPINHFNITFTDVLPHKSGGALNVGILEKVAETARSVGLVHLVDPKLALHLVDEIYKRVGVHNVREGFNG